MNDNLQRTLTSPMFWLAFLAIGCLPFVLQSYYLHIVILALMLLSALENVFPPVPADVAAALGAFWAVRAGIPVRRLKVSIYMFSAFTAGLAGILMTGWLGSVTTNLGQGMELAGYRLSAEMFARLHELAPNEDIRLTAIDQELVGGSPLWLRAEPDEDADQADALAAVIAMGLKQ